MTTRAAQPLVEVTPPSVFDAQWTAMLSRLPTVRPATFLGLGAGDRVVVVGAHPDDETFGLGASIASMAQAGIEIHALSLSCGEAALDHVGRSVESLRTRRAREYQDACEALGVVSATVLGLPDGRLSRCVAASEAAVAESIQRVEPAHVLTVWWRDPHPDHRAAGEASVAAARAVGCPVSGFPVWAQHWVDPAGEQIRSLDIQPMGNDARAHQARSHAADCYRSQTEPLSHDLAPILPPTFVQWTREAVVRG